MKMHKLSFVKMAGAGNDFIVIDNRRGQDCFSHKNIAEVVKALCSRRTGIGADGVLVLEKSKRADFKMRILNAAASKLIINNNIMSTRINSFCFS